MKIRVTRKHIREGMPKNPPLCPVALAIKEALPPNTFVCVSQSHLYISDNGDEKPPWKVRAFINCFDRYPRLMKALCPAFTFQLFIY